jgi:hypothetical protein
MNFTTLIKKIMDENESPPVRFTLRQSVNKLSEKLTYFLNLNEIDLEDDFSFGVMHFTYMFESLSLIF